MMVLVPSDVLNPRRVDEHFAAEAAAAREAGLTVGLVDHDALAAGEAERAVSRVVADAAAAWTVARRLRELGDGQVSDRPRTLPADAFIAAVAALRPPR